jgi:uncharacterized protein (TIGR02147 family)
MQAKCMGLLGPLLKVFGGEDTQDLGVAAGEAIDVFEFVDFRAYLRDYYAHAKRARRGFSHRAFSRKVGLGSPNHLKRVMDGTRNLTPAMASRFALALGLEGEAADYFVQLVELGQARTSLARSRAYDKLTSFKAYRKTRTLDLAQAAYHSRWYIPAVRELAGRSDFRAEPKWIAARLLPPIKPAEARAALDTLLEIGLLRREGGKIVQSEPLVTTGPEMHALHIANYHRMMMQRAAHSIDLVASAGRDISALTLLVDAGAIARIKQRMRRFRRELLELAVVEKQPVQVLQLNFQIFPLSTVDEEKEG